MDECPVDRDRSGNGRIPRSANIGVKHGYRRREKGISYRIWTQVSKGSLGMKRILKA